MASGRARRISFARQKRARGPAFRAMRALYRSFRFEKTPEGRAELLLRQWLRPDQLAQVIEHGYLDVTGCHSGRRYRIYCGWVGNVRMLDARGRPEAGLCFYPVGRLPSADVMLAQKIALETDERGTLHVAYRFPSTSRPLRRRQGRWT